MSAPENIPALPAGFETLVIAEGRPQSDLRSWVVSQGQGPLVLTPRSLAPSPLVLLVAGNSCDMQIEISEHVQAQVMTLLTDPIGHKGQQTVRLARESKVEWITWQTNVIDMLFEQTFALEQGSGLHALSLQSGSDQARLKSTARLLGSDATCSLRGLAFAKGSQKLENEVKVLHLAPRSTSSQLFKSVLRDAGKSTFRGLISVDRLAQKTNASQKHHSLNFHSTAQSITEPALEINADDVKASHGATVGRLDAESLFYLQSRGISKAQSQQLLARAFIADVLLGLETSALRRFVSDRLDQEIPDFLHALESWT